MISNLFINIYLISFYLKKGLTTDKVYELSFKLRILLKFYVFNLFLKAIKSRYN